MPNAECDVCGYDYDRYITAKSVVADYIGEADGEPHTVNVTDYSENPVITSIKYGDSPDNITSNTAPNFVDEGAYDVWYKITYTAGEANTTAVASFEEIGNAKVLLYKKDERKAPSATLNGGDVIITNEDGTSVVVHTHNYEYKYTVSPTSTALGYEIWQCDGCGETEQRNFVAQTGEDTHNFVYKYTVDPTCISDGYEIWQCANCGSIQRQNYKSKSNHKYVYQSTVPATCTGVGYEIWQCSDCGMTDKRSYTNAAGHNYKKTEIREASCAQTGLNLYICKNCGDSYTEVTPINPIKHTHMHRVDDPAASCEDGGKVYDRCDGCGYSVLVDVTKPLGHSWNTSYVLAPTCTEKGYTVEQCDTCKEVRITNYVDELGHNWNENGTIVSEATCGADGLKEFTCKNCGDKKYEAISKTGHKPGAAATCTEPQTCIECGAILDLPTGHHGYTEVVTMPTCTSMGYTTFICSEGDHSYVSDYTDKIPHHYHSEITPATCTSLGYTTYRCTECNDEYVSDYVEKKPHNYEVSVTPPTCTAMGFSTFTCKDCGASYIGDYTDIVPHNYTKKVIEPTCTSQGYTVFSCPDCGKEFIGDEKESTEHHFHAAVTEPTCTEMGFTSYVCEDCNYSYIADYTNPLGHDYGELVVPPTCTEIGYSVFTCSRCKDEYIGNEKSKKPHDYEVKTVAPTCTEMGYSVFRCKDCNDEYIGSYTDAAGHDYEEIFTPPTCTELGYTTFVCKHGDENHVGNEVAALGHTPSDWIVDTPATINAEGHKHIECTVCGEVLEETKIDRLTDTGYTDEEGTQVVGNYDVTVTDKDGKPVFNSNIVIDENDNISIMLPDGRSITHADKTTVTVKNHSDKLAAKDIYVLVSDHNGNNSNGRTDSNGQLTVPNTASNAENKNTVADNENTYIVVVTDRNGNVIPDCHIKAGGNYAIDVYLPTGTPMNSSDRITVTVVNEQSKPYEGITVIVIGDNDNIERGITNVNGQVTVPMSNQAITDPNGIANVGGYIVRVENEPKESRSNRTPVEGALVTLTEDNKLLVKLPDGRIVMDFDNRTTVTVTNMSGTPVADMDVNIYSRENEEGMTEKTNKNGEVTVPPWYMDVVPTAEPNATPTPKPDFEPTAKPDFPDATTEPAEAPTAAPEGTGNPAIATIAPTADPNATAAPSPKPAKPSDYNVTVTDNDGTIGGATVIVDSETGAVRVELPDGKDITADNRIVTTVTNKETGEPIVGVPVTVADKDGDSASDLTNTEGKAIVPPTNSDITDTNGDATVVEGDKVYHINVKNELDGNIPNAVVSVNEGAFTVELPDGKIIDYNNRTTVAVKDSEYAPVVAANVTVSDKAGISETNLTDYAGQVIVPSYGKEAYTDNNGHGIVGKPNEDGTADIYNVVVEDSNGKIDNAHIILTDDGKIKVELPDGKKLTTSNKTTVTVTKDDEPVKGVYVTISDGSTSKSASTNVKGQVTLPYSSSGAGGSRSSGGSSHSSSGGGVISSVTTKNEHHAAYVIGYEEGDFRPEGNMTRAEAAAIFARNIAERKGEKIPTKVSSYSDVTREFWYNNYICYLDGYKLINGYSDGTFRPDAPIKRSEFVAMCMRFHDLFENNVTSVKTSNFSDIEKGYWATEYINRASTYAWINGYADGTFRPESRITRAEVVAIVNRATNRRADLEYIEKHNVNTFTDIKDKSFWAYGDILEAANGHNAAISSNTETWTSID